MDKHDLLLERCLKKAEQAKKSGLRRKRRPEELMKNEKHHSHKSAELTDMTPKEKFEQIIVDIENEIIKCEIKEPSEIAEKVARRSGYTQRSLASIFNFLTNQSLIPYIKQRQLAYAYYELKKGVSGIDAMKFTSYSDQPSFIKAFKKQFNVTPTDTNRIDVNNHSLLPLSWNSINNHPESMEQLYIQIIENENDNDSAYKSTEKETPVKSPVPLIPVNISEKHTDPYKASAYNNSSKEYSEETIMSKELDALYGVGKKRIFEAIDYLMSTDQINPEEARKLLNEAADRIYKGNSRYGDDDYLELRMKIDDLLDWELEMPHDFIECISEDKLPDLEKLTLLYKDFMPALNTINTAGRTSKDKYQLDDYEQNTDDLDGEDYADCYDDYSEEYLHLEEQADEEIDEEERKYIRKPILQAYKRVNGKSFGKEGYIITACDYYDDEAEWFESGEWLYHSDNSENYDVYSDNNYGKDNKETYLEMLLRICNEENR